MLPSNNDSPVTYFGQTDSRGRRTPFGIKSLDRSRHMYIIGKTGMGKSTLLENMAIQDIRTGRGLCFIDPHGKTADLLLDYVPEHRLKDVLYFAPFDMEYPVSFNIMEDVGPDKRHLVTNGLMSTFEKIWEDAWSARMAYILNNTLLALLEYPGSTLLGVNRMLSDKEYRKLVVANITDPSVRSFWVDEFAKYTDRYTQEATPAIQNKVGQFTSNPLIRNIIGQQRSTFNLRALMDEKKIVIMNLSKGKVGEGNANLLGSMLITKIYLAAMSRADASERELQKLPDFYLYVDEFQSFANKSFADILSEARKYKLNLTLAHQYIEQMEEEVRAAVFGNVGTMVVFRVGAYDAEVLEKEFAPAITAEDLVNLGIYQIYLKLMIDGVSSAPFSATTLPPIERPAESFREKVIASSRAMFARPRAIVEEEIRAWHAPILPPPKERKDIPERRDAPAMSPAMNAEKPAAAGSGSASPARTGFERPRPEVRPERQEMRQEVPRSPIQSNPPVRPYMPSAQTPAPATPPKTDRPVPLSSLRPAERKENHGSGKNLSELRKALSDVLGANNSPDKKDDSYNAGAGTNPKPAPGASAQHEARRPQEKDEQAAPREIPENMLRKLLSVDQPLPNPQKNYINPNSSGAGH